MEWSMSFHRRRKSRVAPSVEQEVAAFVRRFQTWGENEQQALIGKVLNAAYPRVLPFAVERSQELLQARDFLDGLPDELGCEILAHLSEVELCRVRLVSLEWRRLASDPMIWRRLCAVRFKNVMLAPSSRQLAQLLAPHSPGGESPWAETMRFLAQHAVRMTNLARYYHSVAVDDRGAVWYFGQSTIANCEDMRPKKIVYEAAPDSALRIVAACGGNSNCLLLQECGRLLTLGRGPAGQLGLGTEIDKVTQAVPVEFPGICAEQDGSLKGEGRVLAVDSGLMCNAALTDHGLYTWGWGAYGKLGHNNEQTVYAPKLVRALRRFRVLSFACGEAHMLAHVEATGPAGERVFDVYGWGRARNGRLGIGDDQRPSVLAPVLVRVLHGAPVRQLSAGHKHSAAVLADGTLWTWGKGDDGRLGHNDFTTRNSPDRVTRGPDGWQCVSAGGYHTVGLSDTGKVYAWGWAERGQIGLGEEDLDIPVLEPTVVPALRHTRCCTVSAGFYHSLAVTEDGQLYTWGGSARGAVGHGSNAGNVTEPRLVEGLGGPVMGMYLHAVPSHQARSAAAMS